MCSCDLWFVFSPLFFSPLPTVFLRSFLLSLPFLFRSPFPCRSAFLCSSLFLLPLHQLGCFHSFLFPGFSLLLRLSVWLFLLFRFLSAFILFASVIRTLFFPSLPFPAPLRSLSPVEVIPFCFFASYPVALVVFLLHFCSAGVLTNVDQVG